MITVAINGFGRIGRTVLRAGLLDKDINFVAVNDLADIKTLAYLLKYDSVHGNFDGTIEVKGDVLVVNDREIKVFSEKEPDKLPWSELNVDIVIESTGFFTTKEKASLHLKAGAKKVLLSAPGKGDDPIKTIVYGVNEDDITPEDTIISNASCTTNSIAPIAKVLHEHFGIEKGFLTTIHAFTADQHLIDAPHRSDPRRGRAAAVNIVPTSTGAAKAVGIVIPELKGKLDGIAIRVPTADGSISDFVAVLKKEATVEEINAVMKKEADNGLQGIIKYTEDPIVSSDIIGETCSGIFDSLLTHAKGNLIKVCSWYDNEWGYSCRMIHLLKKMV